MRRCEGRGQLERGGEGRGGEGTVLGSRMRRGLGASAACLRSEPKITTAQKSRGRSRVSATGVAESAPNEETEEEESFISER